MKIPMSKPMNSCSATFPHVSPKNESGKCNTAIYNKGIMAIGMMRISKSGHIHFHVSAIVDRTTSEDFIDDTDFPLLGRKTCGVCVVVIDYIYFLT